MSAPSSSSLAALLREHRLLEAAQQAEVDRDLAARSPDADDLLAELGRRGWLTAYQQDQLRAGHGASLRLGPYVITDWLGAGGMGEVYQARQDKLGRTVALKVIRRERLEKPDAVRRFHREIRAAARLDHPNIVRAYDADDIGGTHLLVMEFVPGTDLARLVRDRGPLAPAVATEYVRQTALGLQHAAERGLVHRDLKPANLLLTPTGTVKILDMGLARLQTAAAADESSTVTREGVVMGSPDFIAPEQAMNPRTTDVRADLYSLGCTFYFLLTGRPPFPGGETVQKLMRHQLEEPTPVETLRPDVPWRAAAVVRRLMAKRPEDRFQTPADVAAALAPDGPDPASFPSGRHPSAVRPFDLVAWDEVVSPDDDRTVEMAAPRPRRRLAVVGAVAAVVLLLAAVGLLLKYGRPPAPPPEPPHQPRVEPPPPPQPTFEEWLTKTRALTGHKQIEAVQDELRKRNGGRLVPLKNPVYEGTAIVELHVLIDHARDLSPLQAFPALHRLWLDVEGGQKSPFADLGGLKGLRLTFLKCQSCSVRDLSPLQGMPLDGLYVNFNENLDSLAGLKGLKLRSLWCEGTAVTDLEPVRGMPLTNVFASGNPGLKDLGPLEGMPLVDVRFSGTGVTDLGPLAKSPLVELHFHTTRVTTLAPLATVKTLTFIDAGGGLPLTDLSPLAGLTELKSFSCAQVVGVTDLTPLAGLRNLQELSIYGTGVADLGPLERVPLTGINFGETKVSDLKPVAKIKTLTNVEFKATPVTDLGPLAGLPDLRQVVCSECKGVRDVKGLAGTKVKYLYLSGSGVTDLDPLKGLPLEMLHAAGLPVTDFEPIKDAPLKELWCDLQPKDVPVIRAITTLERLNGRPVAEALKKE